MEQPTLAKNETDLIIKNTYQTLITRGMKGCYLYCTDKETAQYFESRLKPTQNYLWYRLRESLSLRLERSYAQG
ncbi:DUF2075 domain-containing protein [Pseudomonas shahriarae]|nr:DUF2075 domain-containing protein [Pseudomonas shahriarae]